MGLFDLFSGHDARVAAVWAADQAKENQADADARIAAGQQQELGYVDQGQTSALDALGGGYDAARSKYGDASALYQPYVDLGQKALGAYADGTGLNGSTGNASATAAFQSSPGYQYQVNQATDAVARKASALGALGSGNTQVAITNTASNLANQEYSSYLDRLKGISDQGYSATGAQAGLTKGIGDLDASQGNAESNLYTTDAATKAGIVGNNTSLGVSTAQNTGNQVIQAGEQGLMADYNASANAWGAILGGAKLGAGLLGSAFGNTGWVNGASTALGKLGGVAG